MQSQVADVRRQQNIRAAAAGAINGPQLATVAREIDRFGTRLKRNVYEENKLEPKMPSNPTIENQIVSGGAQGASWALHVIQTHFFKFRLALTHQFPGLQVEFTQDRN